MLSISLSSVRVVRQAGPLLLLSLLAFVLAPAAADSQGVITLRSDSARRQVASSTCASRPSTAPR